MTQQQPSTKHLPQTKLDDYGGIEAGTSQYQISSHTHRRFVG